MGHRLKKRVVCKYHWSDYTTPDPKHFLAQASSLDLFLLVFLSEFPVLLARYCQYILEEERLVPVQRWLLLAHLYILVRKIESQVPLSHLIEYLYILVFQLSQGQQSLQLEFLYTLVSMVPFQALRLLQTARLYRLVCQLLLVPPKPQTGRPQPLAQLFLVRRWHQLGFPDTQVAERLARVQRLLLLGCQYIQVFQLFQGQQSLPLDSHCILVMEPESQALLFLQTEVLHSVQLPS